MSLNPIREERNLETISRDEMNLAEFPLAVLSTRVNPNVKTLEFSDSLRLSSGETIERKWLITGADKFGLPTSTDDDVILGLLKLTMDKGFRERKIYFTRYELLRILRWSTEGRSYTRLNKSLDRLSGVRIRATNAFYDNSSKAYQTCNFGIVDAYEINDERGLASGSKSEQPTSFFIWSEMLFDSFSAGFIKKINLDNYFELKSALSRRLYRYLDKHFYYRPVIERPFMNFAYEKLGLSRTNKYFSTLKQQIEPAIEELIEIGFLAGYEMIGKGQGSIIQFRAGVQDQDKTSKIISYQKPSGTNFTNHKSAKDYPSVVENIVNSKEKTELIEALISRGITYAQATRLLSSKSEAECRQIELVISYYDHLIENKDAQVFRNRIGFLYRAVEAPFRFSIPASFLESEAKKVAHTESARRERAKRRPELNIVKAPRTFSAETRSEDVSKLKYHKFLDVEVSQQITNLGENQIQAIYSSVEKKVSCLKSLLGEEKYREVLQKGVKDEVVKVCGLPTYEQWKVKN
jgi:Replication initiator protein A